MIDFEKDLVKESLDAVIEKIELTAVDDLCERKALIVLLLGIARVESDVIRAAKGIR